MLPYLECPIQLSGSFDRSTLNVNGDLKSKFEFPSSSRTSNEFQNGYESMRKRKSKKRDMLRQVSRSRERNIRAYSEA